MRFFSFIPVSLLVFAYAGCGARDQFSPKNSNPLVVSGPRQNLARKLFFDEKKQIPPRQAWHKQTITKRAGNMTFRITSQGPFTAAVLTDKLWQAVQKKDDQTIQKEKAGEILFVDCKELELEKTVSIPAGSTWIVISNQTDQPVEIHLQCYEEPSVAKAEKQAHP